jgi:hypothetical protein
VYESRLEWRKWRKTQLYTNSKSVSVTGENNVDQSHEPIMVNKFLGKLLLLFQGKSTPPCRWDRAEGLTRINFCNENKVILIVFSSRKLSFSVVSFATREGEFTSLNKVVHINVSRGRRGQIMVVTPPIHHVIGQRRLDSLQIDFCLYLFPQVIIRH